MPCPNRYAPQGASVGVNLSPSSSNVPGMSLESCGWKPRVGEPRSRCLRCSRSGTGSSSPPAPPGAGAALTFKASSNGELTEAEAIAHLTKDVLVAVVIEPAKGFSPRVQPR